jgi:hypothetical protein
MAAGSSASLEMTKSGSTEFLRTADEVTWITRIPAA